MVPVCTKGRVHVFHPALDHDPSFLQDPDPLKNPLGKATASHYPCPRQLKQGVKVLTPVECLRLPHVGRW